MQLGALPLIGIAAAIAAAAGAGGWLWLREREYEHWKQGLPKPTSPPPPPAPKTERELRTWDPEKLYQRQREQWRDWAPSAIPDAASLDPSLIAAMAVAAVSLLLLLRS